MDSESFKHWSTKTFQCFPYFGGLAIDQGECDGIVFRWRNADEWEDDGVFFTEKWHQKLLRESRLGDFPILLELLSRPNGGMLAKAYCAMTFQKMI